MNESTQNGEGASTRNDTLGRASEKDAAGHARCAEEPQRIASGRTLPDGSIAYDAREAHPFIALAAPVVAIIVVVCFVAAFMHTFTGATEAEPPTQITDQKTANTPADARLKPSVETDAGSPARFDAIELEDGTRLTLAISENGTTVVADEALVGEKIGDGIATDDDARDDEACAAYAYDDLSHPYAVYFESIGMSFAADAA